MGYYDGKLLYRGWLSAQADNGPLLFASSPTGNGELVCAKEYLYYFNGTSPSYNTPFYRSDYDGTGWGEWYSSDFDGEVMFDSSSLLSVAMDLAYPSRGILPIAYGGTKGTFRTGKIYFNKPDEEDVWDAIVVPFLVQSCYDHIVDTDTGKKLYVFFPKFEIYTFTYPSQKEIEEEGKTPPEDPQTGRVLTFQEVVQVVQTWGYEDWAHGTLWRGYINDDERGAVCWNWRKKGYGTTMPMNTASFNWVVNQRLMGQSIANWTLLQTPGTYEIFIAK